MKAKDIGKVVIEIAKDPNLYTVRLPPLQFLPALEKPEVLYGFAAYCIMYNAIETFYRNKAEQGIKDQ